MREGEVVEQDRQLATLDPTFASADVNQLQQQIDSLDAEIVRDEAELANKTPVFSGPRIRTGSDTAPCRRGCSTNERRSTPPSSKFR